MKLSIFFILLFITLNKAWSFDEIWKLGDKFVPLSNEPKKHILVSKACREDCEALKYLKVVSLKNIASTQLSGGKNPGAVLCDENKSARVIYLKDMHGNENSFCFFSDKSFISNGSLLFYAQKNDGAKK